MTELLDAIKSFLGTTGFAKMFSAESDTAWWQYLIMYVIIGALFYLAIAKKFEPLLLMPIAFGPSVCRQCFSIQSIAAFAFFAS